MARVKRTCEGFLSQSTCRCGATRLSSPGLVTAPNKKAKRYWCKKCQSVFRASFPLCPLDGAPLARLDGDPWVNATLDGRYVIEECVGEGGMGRIYRARHRHMSRRFAIKMLFGDLAADEKMRARFHQEAEAACRLSHPNVVSVVDVGETAAKQPYLAMDYVDGISLKRLIKQSAPLEKRRAAALLWQLASGLSHAHDKGLVHRDFKPANVLVIDEGRGEVPKILDFGIARILEDGFENEFTTEGTVMGTPAYMSPEHAMGDEELDHRTDLFSLGVVLYQMLCGKLPFDGTGPEVATKNLSVAPPPIATRVPGLAVDPVLETIAHRLMAKSANDRYHSGKDVVNLLVDSSLVRTDSRGQGEPRLTLLRASEPIPEPQHPHLDPGGSASFHAGAFLSDASGSQVNYDDPVPSLAQQSGVLRPVTYSEGAMQPMAQPHGSIPPIAHHGGTIPPVSTHGGSTSQLAYHGQQAGQSQQWMRPPTHSDGTMHVRVPTSSGNRRLGLLVIAVTLLLAIIISILLYRKLTAPAEVPVVVDAGVLDAAPADAAPTDAATGPADAGPAVDARAPDARPKSNGQRPKIVSQEVFERRYRRIGKLVDKLVKKREGNRKAEQIAEEYFDIDPVDYSDDPAGRQRMHKKLKKMRVRIRRLLP